MASPHHVLTHLIESELRKDDLLKVADPERVRNIAENLARKLLAGRDEYRSGRRGFDRLRDVLWQALQWKPKRDKRRWDDS